MDSEGRTGVDDVMTRLGQALEAAARDQSGRRQDLEALWAEIGAEHGDPLHRMAIAHALADVQDNPREELTWDQLALQAAHDVSDQRVAQAGMPGPAAALYPSLHLNLAEDHRKLGDLEAARRHVTLGLQSAVHLQDDGYGHMIHAGLQRLADRLAAPSP